MEYCIDKRLLFKELPESVLNKKNCFLCKNLMHVTRDPYQDDESTVGCSKKKFGLAYDDSWQEELFSISVFAEVTDCPFFDRVDVLDD